ncbi:DEAD/DEAH box helicase [Desulfosporosinus shakirovi]|uniref:DEAD/DEAH box helicase n=1 Tax=Desulfosporosinus shakirovi TaxID=2885154 RepID=UPI001E439D67|nr:DEAD/DEAH box helicase [Desulfosporosinus sp. SRJS8]MCB8814729.1 DEAD/DEAH box helicase [Desulfosporosinus sp. SRJS8]
MNIVEYVEDALRDPNSILPKIERIQEDAVNVEWQNDSQTLQELRCGSRFLQRYSQYRCGQIQKMDFLSALRDFVLFVGRLSTPIDICTLVSLHGEPFGLYMEGNVYINAFVSRPGWFTNDTFVRQVYGKLQADLFKKQPVCGDELLYKATGFSNYRSFEQKISVQTALQMPDGYSLLLSLPTGAGKSLITQMLAANGDGLTIVIVPTVALGLDQYRAAKFILRNSLLSDQMACYCGEVDTQELHKIYSGLENGSLRLLITSPEAIVRNEKLKSSLYSAANKQPLTDLVIDEAHIVQDWGALFRPDFQMLSVIRKELFALCDGKLKTILLSATLTEDTVENLKILFSNNEQWIELRCDSLRTEPRFCIEKANNQQMLQNKVLHYCCILPKPMIIYEIKPEKAEQWKGMLRQAGFSNVVTFTGDTDDDRRIEIIKLWSEDKLDIVVATSAFGLGVDKPDVRTVMHTTLPENINRFYQEVGRGGRDGLPSLSMLCYSPHDDVSIQRYIANSRVMTVEKMIDRWFSMLLQEDVERDGDTVLLDTSTPPARFTESEKEHSGIKNMRWNINLLLFLMRYGFLDFTEMVYIHQKKCYFIRVTMRDVQLMQDIVKLREALEPFREQEVKSVTSGYEAIKEMVSKADKMCWSYYFTQLFPNAPLACGGCPNHSDAYCNDGPFSFHNKVPWYAKAPSISDTLNKLLIGLNSLLVVRHENEPWIASKALQLAVKFNELGLGAVVMPNTDTIDATVFKGLVLDVQEFELLAKQHPAIFSRGLICAFDDNSRTNQIQYRWANTLERYGITVVYYCRENMIITQANRPIRHLLNCNTLAVPEIMEV